MDVSTDRDASRVTTYLDDVARMLADVDPVERAEVLAGLREHLDDALGSDPTPAQVDAALRDLGDPADVVTEALADRGGSGSAPGRYATAYPAGGYAAGSYAARPPAMQRGWVPVVVAILLGLALFTVLSVAGGLAMWSPVEVGMETSDGVVTTEGIPRDDAVLGVAWGGFLIALVTAGLPWIVGAGLMGASPLWTQREKLLGAGLVPLAAAVMAGAVQLSGSLESGTVLLVGSAVVVVGSIWLLVRLVTAGSRRASEITRGG